jgi:hypothetical protein
MEPVRAAPDVEGHGAYRRRPRRPLGMGGQLRPSPLRRVETAELGWEAMGAGRAGEAEDVPCRRRWAGAVNAGRTSLGGAGRGALMESWLDVSGVDRTKANFTWRWHYPVITTSGGVKSEKVKTTEGETLLLLLLGIDCNLK